MRRDVYNADGTMRREDDATAMHRAVLVLPPTARAFDALAPRRAK